MRKTFAYSFCGLFITSAAVATTLYMDIGANSQCGGFCLENPGNGACCPSGSVMTSLDVSSDSVNNTVEGLYLDGVKLFDFDGTARALSTEEIATIRASHGSDAQSGTSVQLTKKEYDNGTQYVVFDENGEFAEYDAPQKGGVFCDHVKIMLYNGYNTDNPVKVYYKKGAGYYADPARTTQFNWSNAKITRNGYTLRGYFTSTWSSSTTGMGSYINNLSPYRTIGWAYIPWTNTVTAPVTSSDTIRLQGTNKVYSVKSCPNDGSTESSYPIVKLYAGWAQNCDDTTHCELKITGQSEYSSTPTRTVETNQKVSVTGKWLPGAVEYNQKGSCGTGYSLVGETTTPAKVYSQVSSQSLNFTVGTYALTCASDTPTKIKITYHNSANTTTIRTCNIDGTSTTQIPSNISGESIDAFAYTSGGTAVFTAGQNVDCKIGSGGFTSSGTSDDYYLVNLYPAAEAPTQPTMTQIQIKYTVTLDDGTDGGMGLGTTGTVCTNTATCNVGASVALKQSLSCSGETVSISKWARSNGTEISGFSAQCTEAALGPVTYNNGTYSVTLTGTLGGGTNSFICPQNIYTPSASQHITVSGPSQSNPPCTYTVSCANGYENLTGGSATVTCSDQQSCAALSFTGYACTATQTFTCPDAPSNWDTYGSVTRTVGTNSCTYTLNCNTDFNLYNRDDKISKPKTITCNDDNCTDTWLSNQLSNYSCKLNCPTVAEVNNELAGMDNLTVTGMTPWPDNNYAKCKYDIGCLNDYILNPQYSHTWSCGGDVACQIYNVVSGITSKFQCTAPTPTFTCPDPNDLQKPNVMTISAPTLDSSTQTCTYTLGCTSGYAIPMDSPYGSPQTISCTGDQCSTGQHLESLIDERQNHPLARCGKVWSTEACSATYAEGSNAAGTITTGWNSSDYNGTLCILNGTCDKLHCNPGTLGDKYCDGSMRLCGAGGGSESVTENCLQLVQNYANVSCSNDCPSLAKVNEFVLGNIEYAYAFTDTNHLGNQCAYLLECESGYTPSISYATCSKTNGCKLGSSDWVFPTCVYDYGY